ncbi:hypothetical protein [Leptospira gomenensis]|uniref:hypothetical protein n=1 Tax=Leptospira gomenensis TaxID=2484974 RepID=UPI001AF01CCD|nr:hypothetical protein [Leptospira gomenensis]
MYLLWKNQSKVHLKRERVNAFLEKIISFSFIFGVETMGNYFTVDRIEYDSVF